MSSLLGIVQASGAGAIYFYVDVGLQGMAESLVYSYYVLECSQMTLH